jgi:hypothetical protein
LGFYSPEEKRFKNTKRGTVTISVLEAFDCPLLQISLTHASNVSVYLFILAVIEIIEVSSTRIKANAFLINM